jgi:AAA ATPase domain
VERNRSFVGRKAHLQQIKDLFHRSVAEHNFVGSPLFDGVVILYGLGGMGKTQLALKYAAENAEMYSAVLWINASNERNAHLGFRDTAKRYVDAVMDERGAEVRQRELRKLYLGHLVNADGELSFDEANLREITKSVISFLERDDNDNWLLILDNLDDLQSFDITDFLPKSPTRKVIITSRLTATTRLGYAVEVDAIDEGDAVEILLNNSPLRSKSITGMLNYIFERATKSSFDIE